MKWSAKLHEDSVVILICLLLTATYSLGSYIYFKTSGVEISDYAQFGGDTWEYQSMAVNFASGHGLKIGAIEDFDFYKFNPKGNTANSDCSMEDYKRFIDVGDLGGRYNFYRTPGYPFFLGLIYKIFGVSPKAARIAQVFLIVLVAAFLPYIGFAYWRLTGFAAGVVSGAMVLRYIYIGKLYEGILTEPLIIFSIFLTIIMFIHWEKKKTTAISAALGIFMGVGILVKGSLIFTPVLTGFYFIYLINIKLLRPMQFSAFVVGCAFVVLSWSIFASVNEGRPIFISSQGQQLLLDSNSVASKDGRWRNIKPDEFYQRPEIRELPGLLKVVRFYLNHRELLPSIFINKVNSGFNDFFFFKLTVLFILYEILARMLQFFDNGRKIVVFLKTFLSLSMVINLGWIIVLVTLLLFENPLDSVSYRLIMDIPNMMPGSSSLLSILAVLLCASYAVTHRLNVTVPAPFIIFFLNILLITLVFCGEPRFISVIAFSFTLTAMQFVVRHLVWLYRIVFSSYQPEPCAH